MKGSIGEWIRWLAHERPTSAPPMDNLHGQANRRLARLHQCHLLAGHRHQLSRRSLGCQQIWPQNLHLHCLSLPHIRSVPLRRLASGELRPFALLRRLRIALVRDLFSSPHQRDRLPDAPWHCERSLPERLVRRWHGCCLRHLRHS